MANTSQSLITLDFATYKNSLKEYLRNNPIFKDYEYEASNMSLLLDLLAYNTFQTAFYTNMVMSESFIDSAQLRSSIVSHAKDLNYLPVSAKSAKATVNVTFTATGASSPYTIAKASPFSTLIKNKSFVFYTAETQVATYTGNNTYQFTANIYEGLYVNDTFVYPAVSDIERFRLSNQEIDTDSITVTVFENGSQYGDTYIPTDTLLGLDGSSKVYFIQAAADGFYEILFGDNIFGHQPLAGSLIHVNYRTTAGEEANGAKVFSCDFDPTGASEMTGSANVTTVSTASSGSPKESIESIRSYAPRYFATQQRAVASDDYASIILAKFPSTIQDVNVYGGETLNPKRYGWVAVALKPTNGDVAPDYVKEQISNMLLKYISVPNKVLIQDPEYFYLDVHTTVEYDSSRTTNSKTDIQTNIQNKLVTFANTNFERFGKDFRYSRFVNAIDNADDSIISNDTTVRMIKRLAPVLNMSTNVVVDFDNAADIEGDSTVPFDEEPVLISDTFAYVDMDAQLVYQNAYIRDDGLGNVGVFTSDGATTSLVKASIGTIDYESGLLSIDSLIVSNYTNHISLYYSTAAKDILVQQKNIILLDLNDVNITLVASVA